MQNRIYVREAIRALRYKKRASFNRWCRLNEVQIYSDHGSNKHYVIEVEFSEALSRNPIRHIPELFKIKHDSEKFNSFMRVTSEIRSYKDQRNGYVPSSDNERRVLSMLIAEAGGEYTSNVG